MASQIQPRGPSADPKYLPSTDASNPYSFSPQSLEACGLPPKVTDKYVFFFSYEGSDPHICLSQWFPCPFTGPRNPYKNDNTPVEFPTSEHYMMYHKALLMGDQEIADKIIQEGHPSTTKKLGRQIRGFDPKIWNDNADRVVEEGNGLKFEQNEDLKKVMLDTGDRTLVEASPDDKIWGIGFSSKDAEGNESKWGNNALGKALMNVRDKLRSTN